LTEPQADPAGEPWRKAPTAAPAGSAGAARRVASDPDLAWRLRV